MKTKKYQLNSNKYLYFSVTVNILGILIICYLIYKHRQAKNSKDTSKIIASQPTLTKLQPLTKNSQKARANNESNPYEGRVSAVKGISVQTDENTLKTTSSLINSSDRLQNSHRNQQQEHKQLVLRVLEQNFKQQLELQQERNRFLQQKVNKMQEQLNIAYQKINKVNHINTLETIAQAQIQEENGDELTRLRNQLDFCQKRLALSYQTQKELKSQIQIYQKIGQHSLNHPYFNRLLAMNYKYKEIIFNMQRYLLEGPSSQLNFSFTVDQHY